MCHAHSVSLSHYFVEPHFHAFTDESLASKLKLSLTGLSEAANSKSCHRFSFGFRSVL